MDSTFNLKIKTVEGNEKITLLDITPEKGKNCYSFDGIGSGDYEIELNGYQNNRLYQTATQKIKFNSSREYVSTMAMGLASMAKAVGAIYTMTKQISDMEEQNVNLVSNIESALCDAFRIVQIEDEVAKERAHKRTYGF